MTWRVLTADCVRAMRWLAPNSVDAIVCDPPYGLDFMGKEWDGSNGFRRALNAADTGRDDVFGRSSARAPEYRAGKLFQAWCETWALEALRVLKPGGHLLAFGGTRTYHRLASGIEDAGFEVRDCLAWLYGSGFPKSLDVSKAIDKAAGIQGSKGPMKRGGERLLNQAPGGKRDGGGTWGDEVGRDAYTYVPGSPDALAWQGWGTALKPAHEPIIVARKPLASTVAANVLEHGTGALNIDGTRIAGVVPSTTQGGQRSSGGLMNAVGGERGTEFIGDPAGRWPANVLLDADAAAILDAQTGTLKGGTAVRKNGISDAGMFAFGNRGPEADVGYGDSGGASRFFYCAKASRRERNAGLDAFEAQQIRRMNGGEYAHNSGSTTSSKNGAESKNHHPTVKPVDVMRWLCRLVTPPGGLVLDPFTGSGTTGIAAVLEGFRFVGLEQDAAYAAIARARIAWFQQHGEAALETVRAAEKRDADEKVLREMGQLSMFENGAT